MILKNIQKGTVILLLLSIIFFSNTGCYTYHVYQTGRATGLELGNQPGTEWKGKTLHSFFWGAVRQDAPVENCQLGSGERFGMDEVKVETNFAYLFVSVATAGIWVPLKVSWRCGKPCVPTGNLD